MNEISESYFYAPSEHVMVQLDYTLNLVSVDAMDNQDVI